MMAVTLYPALLSRDSHLKQLPAQRAGCPPRSAQGAARPRRLESSAAAREAKPRTGAGLLNLNSGELIRSGEYTRRMRICKTIRLGPAKSCELA